MAGAVQAGLLPGLWQWPGKWLCQLTISELSLAQLYGMLLAIVVLLQYVYTVAQCVLCHVCWKPVHAA